jgi:hypothetical protein
MAKLKISLAGELGMVPGRRSRRRTARVVQNAAPLLQSRCGRLTLSLNISKTLIAEVGSLTLVN